ncbi:hypothetical protein MRX96_040820 [Rhipicephalus microplus]
MVNTGARALTKGQCSAFVKRNSGSRSAFGVLSASTFSCAFTPESANGTEQRRCDVLRGNTLAPLSWRVVEAYATVGGSGRAFIPDTTKGTLIGNF